MIDLNDLIFYHFHVCSNREQSIIFFPSIILGFTKGDGLNFSVMDSMFSNELPFFWVVHVEQSVICDGINNNSIKKSNKILISKNLPIVNSETAKSVSIVAKFLESDENTCMVTRAFACSLSDTSSTEFYHSLFSQSKICIFPAFVETDNQFPSGE